MKKFLLFLFLIGSSFNLFSQQFENNWINYSQKYYRIPISSNGVYRINYNTLVNAGVPVSTIDPRGFQIFYKGVEQYIFIHAVNPQDSNIFLPGHYIEFYAEKNTGWYDTALYHVPGSQINNEYSLFTDTASYYLTSNGGVHNLRMFVNESNDFSNYTFLNYYNKVSRQNYNYNYFSGAYTYQKLYNEEYTDGEGWFDYPFYAGSNISKNIPTPNAFIGGPNAVVDFTIIGASDYENANPDHHLSINFANINIDTLYEGLVTRKFNYSVPTSSLGSSYTNFTFTSLNPYNSNGNPDRNTISHISIKYPHTFDLANDSTERMFVPNSFQAKSYLRISNLVINNTDSARIYDLTNHRRIKVYKSGPYYDALVPNPSNTGEKECFLTSDHQIKNINSITPVGPNAQFINYGATNLLNSNYIIVTDQRLWDKAVEYRDYRISTGYNALLVDIDQLYAQFSYGIRKNPLAIKNYIRYAAATYTDSIKGLFLLGKSYHAGSDGLDCYRQNPTFFANTIVPSIGSPPSDIMFTSGISDNTYTPLVPTGRLAARDLNDVDLYLTKVTEYELAQQTPEEWMKNILHFGGGDTHFLQDELRGYLNNYKRIIEDTLFGGNVKSFWKTSDDPMVTDQSDSLRRIITNGVSLMTFFGHAAGTGFDQSTDLPSEYLNFHKYPIVIANSCLAGDVFGDGISSSEAFVLEPKKAAIGFLASVTQSYVTPLNVYSSELYKNIGVYNYGNTFGNCIKNTIKTVLNNTSSAENINTCLSMNFHGDPVLKVNNQSAPDYTLNTSSVYFEPAIITSELENFTVKVISTNIGRA
ncbi:MAG: hypothetical protein HXX09_14650, partial [Bacteroidetes bacterium]|nr:hypothetical protein [Bacteroidota bacterium]